MTTFDLDREAFREHVDRGDRPVVVRTVATLETETTPLGAYAALTGRTPESDRDRSPYAFLLESAEKTASSDPDGAFRPSSAGAERHARFSYVGYDPEAVVTVGPERTDVETLSDDAPLELIDTEVGDDADTVDALRAAMPDVRFENAPNHGRQHLTGGLVGFLAYDAVYDLWLEEVGLERPDSRFPDAQFVLTTKTIAFDEREGSVSLVCTPVVAPGDDPDAIYDEMQAEVREVAETLREDGGDGPETDGFVREDEAAGSKADYEESVRKAKEHVLDGDIYQGVVSRKRELYGDVDTLGFYEAMREVNPSPYMYLLEHDDLTVVGASPETLVSVRGREVMSNPIAGTCDRGTSPVEDRRLAGEMLADEKERAEHTMLVDLARNDVRRVSEAGTVRVDEFMNVLKYSHVQHIESTVTGRLATDSDVAEPCSTARESSSPDAFDATRAAFPAGTLSGAPKVRAMEIIDDLEAEPRGLYGGGVGYYSWTGDADFAIVIRTATVESVAAPRAAEKRARRNDPRAAVDDGRDRITVQAGAGLVADSDPESEYEETEKKMSGVLAALEEIERSADETDSIGDCEPPEPEVRR
ncbi:anthranilate synthase component I [Natronobacterium gregoryi]|uniref:Anthranilate synthase component 1 n=2 Tax=Natronobacterium gregoryi TaxID=44930 RepID=L0AN15_NATGS|nr:anthranilate synthase component I [Natronobacterium gregoryi]AFZ74864.1 anthranilate synthase component I, archaeal clade [Natronobacterium gregoryi SP2]ELY73282.1 anthranilate synthase component I [Natronobacterium gregoryi SP2]PLK19318.1 anthranilate synthase component I [Natronobacterium gregoryi SP2]SFJ53747.1 anthranilate synthase, component I [Natronobacterium gregoryi]